VVGIEARAPESGMTRRVLLLLVLLILLFVPSNVYITLAGGVLGIIGTYTIVLLFTYVSRYLGADLTKQEVYVLFYALAYSWVFFNSYDVIYRSYLRVSEVTNEYLVGGRPVAELLPTWFSPPKGSPVFEMRTFFHPHTALPLIVSLIFSATWIVAELSMILLSAFLFVEVESLPYPLAPVDAAFITTLSERPAEWLRGFLPAAGLTLALSVMIYMPSLGLVVGGPTLPVGFYDFTQQVAGVLPGAALGINFWPSVMLPGFMIPLRIVATALATSLLVWVLLNSLFITNPFLRSLFPDWAQEYYQGMSYWLIVERSSLRIWTPIQVGALLALSAMLVGRYHRDIARAFSQLARARGVEARGYPSLKFLLASFFAASGVAAALYLILMPEVPPYIVIGLVMGFGFFLSMSNAYMQGMAGGGFSLPPYLWQTAIYSLPPGTLSTGNEVTALLFSPPIVGQLSGGGTQAIKVGYLVNARPLDLVKAIAVAYAIGTIVNILVVQAMWSVAPIPSMIFPNTVGFRDRAIGDCLVASKQIPLKPNVILPAFGFFLLLFSLIEAVNVFLHVPLATAGVVMGLTNQPANLIPMFIASAIGNLVIPRLFRGSALGSRWGQLKSVLISGAMLGDGIAASFFTIVTLIGRTSWTWPW